MPKFIKVERKQGHCIIFLNRPEKLNILNKEVFLEISEAIRSLDEGTRAVIIAGKGKSFCAGADLTDFTRFTPKELTTRFRGGTRILDGIERSPRVFIAAIHGYCLGGGLEVAMACDIVIASPDTRIGLPEINLGLLPALDGVKRLARRVGKHDALNLLLRGQTISAREAYRIGLVSEIVRKTKLMNAAGTIAEEIATKNPVAVKSVKRLANSALQKDVSMEEINAVVRCLQTPYAKKAVSDFLRRKK
jgi:enoyl-CoA hydratase/carnithine racemase